MSFDTHDAYIAALPPHQQAPLQALRAQIHARVPKAEEVFAYGVPAFRAGPRRKLLVGYAGMKEHLGLYIFEGDLIARFADRLRAYHIAKGTIRFTPAHPIPEDLLDDLLAARLDEIS